jgi:hypothetical protein
VLWWAKGGVLKGESPARIAFLREVLEDGREAARPLPSEWDLPWGGPGEYYLAYFGFSRPRFRTSRCRRARRTRSTSSTPGT